MTLIQSVLLGALQGLTEFLPVSSSGHLAIAQNIFHIDTGGSILFDILLHLGTLAVVFIVYWPEIRRTIAAFFGIVKDLFHNAGVFFHNRRQVVTTPSGKKTVIEENIRPYRKLIRNNYRKFVMLVIVSTIPTGIIGILDSSLVADASSTLIVPGICLILTGILLLLSDKAQNCVKIPQDVTYREGIMIGIAQGFATLPGLSRSGTTIAACLFCGLNRKFAVMYSFILSIPAILGAAILEIKDIPAGSVTGPQAAICLAGVAAAFAVGMICIKAMLRIVTKRRFHYFAYYCFAVGILCIIGNFVR